MKQKKLNKKMAFDTDKNEMNHVIRMKNAFFAI